LRSAADEGKKPACPSSIASGGAAVLRQVTIPALVVAVVSLLMVAPEARAYLDPSTGSMVVSAIVGIFATLSLGVKTYWYRLKALFRRRPGARRQAPSGSTDAGSDQVRDDGGSR